MNVSVIMNHEIDDGLDVKSEKGCYLIYITGTDHYTQHNVKMIEWIETVICHVSLNLLGLKSDVRVAVESNVDNISSHEDDPDIIHLITVDDEHGKIDLCDIIKKIITISNCVTDTFNNKNSRMIIDLVKLFNIIETSVSEKQIFTTNSLLMIITDLFNIDKNVENMLIMFGEKTLVVLIDLFLRVCKYTSLVDQDDLEKINIFLKNQNISIRNIMYLCKNNSDNLSNPYISKTSLLRILNQYTVPSVCYEALDPDKMIDLVNEIFRPLESITYHREHPMIVIIPSYNNIQIFEDTLRSVFDQNYRHFRIIFVDDCSDSHHKYNGLREVDAVRSYVLKEKQNLRTIVVSQHVRQRQGAGRYIGYHMAYDDEIVILLDGDDRMHNDDVMNSISQNYIEKCIGASYGSYVDMIDNIVQTKIKGTTEFPRNVILNRSYRSHRYISVHLRTAFAKLFKTIRLIDLLDNNDKFFHIMTDFAEMLPVHEMMTPDRTKKRTSHGRLKYFDVIKSPLCIYNMDNSVTYNTSFARRNEDENYYKQYRIDASKKLRSLNPYPFILGLKNQVDNTELKLDEMNSDQTDADHMRYFTDIMINYGFDMLIIDNETTEGRAKITKKCSSHVIKKFNDGRCLFLNGNVLNHEINRVVVKALVCRDITDQEIDKIKQRYRCVIRKRAQCQIDLPVIGYLTFIEHSDADTKIYLDAL